VDNYLVVATEGKLPKRLVTYLKEHQNGITGTKEISEGAIIFNSDSDAPSVASFIQRKYPNNIKVALFEIEPDFKTIPGTEGEIKGAKSQSGN
jgi:hypothetical protein